VAVEPQRGDLLSFGACADAADQLAEAVAHPADLDRVVARLAEQLGVVLQPGVAQVDGADDRQAGAGQQVLPGLGVGDAGRHLAARALERLQRRLGLRAEDAVDGERVLVLQQELQERDTRAVLEIVQGEHGRFPSTP